MSLKTDNDIFRSTSQQVPYKPEDVKLISDRVLIRDLGSPEKVGLIEIPEKYRDKAGPGGNLRIGVVVSVGPGDRFIEHGVTDEGEVRRSLITTKERCPVCSEGSAFRCKACWERAQRYVPCKVEPGKCETCGGDLQPCWFDLRGYELVWQTKCIGCGGTGYVERPVTVPPQCLPGETVLYDRRREAEVFLDGVRHVLCHAEQAVIAVLEV